MNYYLFVAGTAHTERDSNMHKPNFQLIRKHACSIGIELLDVLVCKVFLQSHMIVQHHNAPASHPYDCRPYISLCLPYSSFMQPMKWQYRRLVSHQQVIPIFSLMSLSIYSPFIYFTSFGVYPMEIHNTIGSYNKLPLSTFIQEPLWEGSLMSKSDT